MILRLLVLSALLSAARAQAIAPGSSTGGGNGGGGSAFTAITTTAGGIFNATYVSGGTFSGTGNCSLGTFNGTGGSGATATIAVASGVAGAITVTAAGSAYTSASTTAALSSGTATCSGTATITSTLTPATQPTGSGYWFNDLDNLIYQLPTITTAMLTSLPQLCFENYAAITKAIGVLAPASTSLVYNGTAGSNAGYLTSSGAAGDGICVVPVDTTHYLAVPILGTFSTTGLK